MVIQRSAITRNFPRMLAVAALFALMFGQLYAQVAGATLSGTVSDPSGSFISGAHISIKNVATSQERVVTTDSAGFYSWPNLLVGNAGALDSTSTTSRENSVRFEADPLMDWTFLKVYSRVKRISQTGTNR